MSLEYELSGDGATITGCALSEDFRGVLAIPAELESLPVRRIGDSAFAGCSGLTSVTIPAGVTRIGMGAFSECIALKSVTIPAGVTEIGAIACCDCCSLKSVTIPASVTRIGLGAFLACSSLKSVTIPAGVTEIGDGAFCDCNSLQSVTIPASVTRIGYGAFVWCDELTSFAVAAGNPNYTSVNGLLLTKDGRTLLRGVKGRVTIPSGVREIGDEAFNGLRGLTSVTIPASVTRIGEAAFYDCPSLKAVAIPSGVTEIGDSAFEDCSGLQSVTIPSGVTRIGDEAFECCTSLKAVAIPSGVTEIGAGAFCECSSLESVTIPYGVTEIGDEAFSDCDGLQSVTIPSSVTRIGDEAFFNCRSLKSVTVPASVTEIGDGAFGWCCALASFAVAADNPNYTSENGLLLTKDGQTLLQGVNGVNSRVTIPAGVTEIRGSAFAGLSGLTSIAVAADNPNYTSANGLLLTKDGRTLLQGVNGRVAIPAGVTAIGDSVFAECRGLTSVTIPETVTEIGDMAFHRCSSLTSVTIPDSVTRIGRGAFRDSSLTSVTIPGGVTEVGEEAFADCGLTSMTILAGVTAIDIAALKDCHWLRTLKIPTGLAVSNRNGVSFDGDNNGADHVYSLDTFRGVTVIVDGSEDPEPSEPEPGEGGLAASYGPFVPGAAVSVDVPALVGYRAKGLPSGLKLDAKAGKIVGAAKKGGVTATVTFTKKGAPALTAQFAVGPVPVVSAALAGDAAGCRVTGAGKAYLAGKRVTLAAKAPKGTAFVGWTRDGAPWPDASAARQAKVSFTMPEGDVSLVAAFERERMSLACPVLASMPLTVGVAGDAGGYPLEIVTQSGVKSAKARGLPARMKLAKDRETGAWRVVGAPRRAGAHEVELTVTAASGAQERVTFAVEVAPLPAWAVGTFGGEVDRPNADAEDESDEWRKYGTATLKVSSAGKVTAKVLAGGRAWSFSADGFAAHDAARDAYRFRMETRAGDVFEGEILRDCHDVAALMGERRRDGGIDPDGTFAPAGREPYHVIVWRNENGRDGRLGADATGRARTALDAVKAAGRFALADVDPAWGTVSVTVDAKGNVKASGTTADGVKVLASGGFLALDDADPYVCASLVFHDRKTGLVYDCSPSWQPGFDEAGNLAGTAGDWVVPVHCAPYPFE